MATLTAGRTRLDLDVGPRTRVRALLCARTAARLPAAGTRLTLDELLVGAWEGLDAGQAVACPVCSGAMTPRSGHGPQRAGGGCCRDCGAMMS